MGLAYLHLNLLLYQNVQRCQKDNDDFQLVFGGQDNSGHSDTEEDSDEDMLEEEMLEMEYREKDPVKRQHFKYNEAVAMTHKYPEITVAPGEGETPQHILAEKDWE